MSLHNHRRELDQNLDCEAFIVDAVRTPIGRYGGALASVRPDDLAACAIRALMNRTGDQPERVDDVILGCANQAGEDNRNVARMAAAAGRAADHGGRGHGQPAVRLAACRRSTTRRRRSAPACGKHYIAGGVESMTRAPYVMAKPGEAFDRGNREMYDTTLGWRFTNPRLAEMYYPYSMGETAENVAEKWHVSREEQDAFAYESQMKAKAAIEGGCFQRRDHRRADPAEARASRSWWTPTSTRASTRRWRSWRSCSPAFRKGGTVTAGNASGINDGAAALLVMSGAECRALEYRPMARIVAWAVAGVDPAYMGVGPIPATRKALKLRRADGRRPRPDRTERGVRLAEPGLHPRTGPRPGQGQRERRGDCAGPPARLLRRPPDDHAWSTSCAAATAATASPRCASASARASPRLWSVCKVALSTDYRNGLSG